MGWGEAPTDEARAGAPACQVGLESCPMNHNSTAQHSLLCYVQTTQPAFAVIQAQNTPAVGNYY